MNAFRRVVHHQKEHVGAQADGGPDRLIGDHAAVGEQATVQGDGLVGDGQGRGGDDGADDFAGRENFLGDEARVGARVARQDVGRGVRIEARGALLQVGDGEEDADRRGIEPLGRHPLAHQAAALVVGKQAGTQRQAQQLMQREAQASAKEEPHQYNQNNREQKQNRTLRVKADEVGEQTWQVERVGDEQNKTPDHQICGQRDDRLAAVRPPGGAMEEVADDVAQVREAVVEQHHRQPGHAQGEEGERGVVEVNAEAAMEEQVVNEVAETGGGGDEADEHPGIAGPLDTDLGRGEVGPGFEQRFGVADLRVGVGGKAGGVDAAHRSGGDDVSGKARVLEGEQDANLVGAAGTPTGEHGSDATAERVPDGLGAKLGDAGAKGRAGPVELRPTIGGVHGGKNLRQEDRRSQRESPTKGKADSSPLGTIADVFAPRGPPACRRQGRQARKEATAGIRKNRTNRTVRTVGIIRTVRTVRTVGGQGAGVRA